MNIDDLLNSLPDADVAPSKTASDSEYLGIDDLVIDDGHPDAEGNDRRDDSGSDRQRGNVPAKLPPPRKKRARSDEEIALDALVDRDDYSDRQTEPIRRTAIEQSIASQPVNVADPPSHDRPVARTAGKKTIAHRSDSSKRWGFAGIAVLSVIVCAGLAIALSGQLTTNSSLTVTLQVEGSDREPAFLEFARLDRPYEAVHLFEIYDGMVELDVAANEHVVWLKDRMGNPIDARPSPTCTKQLRADNEGFLILDCQLSGVEDSEKAITLKLLASGLGM